MTGEKRAGHALIQLCFASVARRACACACMCEYKKKRQGGQG